MDFDQTCIYTKLLGGGKLLISFGDLDLSDVRMIDYNLQQLIDAGFRLIKPEMHKSINRLKKENTIF